MTLPLGATGDLIRAVRGAGRNSPWSDADQARLVRLTDVNSDQLRSSADELEQAATALDSIGAVLRVVASEPVPGRDMAQRCTELAAAVASGADGASDLAGALRRAAAHWDGLTAELARAMLHVVESFAGVADRNTRLADQQAAALAELRNVLDGMDPGAAERDGVWAGVTPGFTVTPEYSAAVWSVWQPWTPVRRPAGSALAGTDGERVESDTGVRVAQLPDGPDPRRARR